MESNGFETAYRDLVSQFVEVEADHTSRTTHLKTRFSTIKSSLNSELSDKQREMDANKEDTLQRLRAKKTIYQEKASPLLESIKDIQGNTRDALSRVGLTDFFVSEEPSEPFLADTDDSFDYMIELMSMTVQEATEEEARLNDEVNRLIAFRHKRASRKRIMVTLCASTIALVIFFVSMGIYCRMMIKTGQDHIQVALQDENWPLVREEVVRLKEKNILKWTSIYNPIFKIIGIGDWERLDIQLEMWKRETLYREAAAAYDSTGWADAVSKFKEILVLDDSFLSRFPLEGNTASIEANKKMRDLYLSSITEYQKERGLKEGFGNIPAMLAESFYYAGLNSLRRKDYFVAGGWFSQIPKDNKYYALGLSEIEREKTGEKISKEKLERMENEKVAARKKEEEEKSKSLEVSKAETGRKDRIQAPSLAEGDEFVIEQNNLSNPKLSYVAERKIISIDGDRVKVTSRNLKSSYVRTLFYSRQWNLFSSRVPTGDGLDYEPAVKYYDFPLFPGKTWSGNSTERNIKTGQVREHRLSAEVGDYETITVPAGTFQTIKVTIKNQAKDIVTGQVTSGTDVSWYAPAVKRSIKSELTTFNPEEGRDDVQIAQLVRYLVK